LTALVARRRPVRPVLPRSTPGRTLSGAVAAVVLACCLAAVIAVAFGGLGGDFRSIGQRDAPEVDAATGLYFSLNDMDAQVANVLLVGGDARLAADRSQDLAIYQRDRLTADQDLQQAAATEAGSASAQSQLRSALNGIGQYEALAAEAILSDHQAASAAGRAPAASLGYYRQATAMMQANVLPAVASLTSVSAAELDATYQRGRTTALTGIIVVTATGLVVLAVLATLQAYLAVRYRRLMNPALIAATVITLGLTAAAASQLGAEAGHLKVAKQDAFDSIIALTQARAVGYDANADESRYLVDPGQAAQYQQAFLTKSQRLAAVGDVGIFGYDAALAADIGAYRANNADVRFGGYLGAEFRNITFPGERAAAVRTLLAYQAYERDDRALRALAKQNLTAAVAFDIGTAQGQSDWAFNQYDVALSSVTAINQDAFAGAVQAGQGGADGWNGVIPAAAAAAIAAGIVIGMWPRLAEYH
jgi:hypothetical protein